jgi:hypothetical protein
VHADDRLLGIDRQSVAARQFDVDVGVGLAGVGNRQAQQTIERDGLRNVVGEDLDNCRGQLSTMGDPLRLVVK